MKPAVLCLTALCGVVAVSAAPYKELVPKFNRLKSAAMVRVVAVPTAANLDYAAYSANPVLFDAAKAKPAAPQQPVTLAAMTFNGLLADVVDRVGQTPLSAAEREHPMAWRPLAKKLWSVVKDQQVQNIAGTVNGWKWADPTVFQPYQDLATAWLHGGGDSTQVWVKVEFSPWVRFVAGVADDEDMDGVREVYGRLSPSAISPDSLRKAIEWIRSDYQTRLLSREQVVDWITDLASYWYPTKNTDIIDMSGKELWPNADTRRPGVKAMRGVTVRNPIAVVEGKPYSPDKPIYNVYVVENLAEQPAAAPQQVAAPSAPAAVKALDTARSINFTDNTARFAAEVKPYGSYEAWAKKTAPWTDALKKTLAGLPAGQMGFKGKGDWVFFRKSLEEMTAGDLGAQPRDKSALPNLVELRDYLAARNVNLLFVVVPNKEDVYYEHLPAKMPDASSVVINPWGRKVLADLQAAGIEVIDLLPHFLRAKEQDKASPEAVYQRQDTHWTNRGLQIAVQLIADRIKQYAWYKELEPQRVAYRVADTTFERLGDIVDKLPAAEQAAYPPVVLTAQRVYTPEGKPNPPRNTAAPILLIGDSFTGVFELVDCKSAGVGSHIAARTGLPVDMITSWGGGPLVREMMVRQRGSNMEPKRVVVYLMVARDLYNYAQGWAPLQGAK